MAKKNDMGYNTIPGCIELYQAGKKMEAFKGISKMNIRRVPKSDMQQIGVAAELLQGNNAAFYAQLKVDTALAVELGEFLFVKHFINTKE